MTIATIANVAAALAASGVGELGLGATGWSVVLLAAAAVIGVGYARSTGRLAVALALAWGLAWVAVARSTGEPRDGAVAVTAAAAAVVTLGSAVVVRVHDRSRNSSRSPAS